MQTKVATAGASVVLPKICASWTESEAAAPLNPYQQNHRIKQPSAPRVKEWPGMALTLIVPSDSLVYLPIRAPQHPSTDQRGQAAYHMDDRGAGKVHISELHQPALAVPDPPCLNGVDHGTDDSGVNTVGYKFGPLGHGTGYNGSCGGTEYELEEKVGPVEIIKIGKHLVFWHADQAEEIVLTIHNTIPQQDKYHGANAKIHQIFHNDIAGIFSPGETRLHHSKSTLHEKDQNCTHQIPYG